MFEERLQHQTKPPVPFQRVPDGLYLMKQPSRFPLVEHYGILVTGKLLGEFGIYNSEPIVIHQTYPNLKVDWARTTGTWELLGQVSPLLIPQAMGRIKFAFHNPNYDLFTNNCEQFARFVAQGQKYSTQVRSGVFMGGLLLLIFNSKW